MTTITDFIEARLAEDERIATLATEVVTVTPKYPAKRPAWEPERWAVDEFDDVRTMTGATDPILFDPSGGGVRSRHVADHIARHDPARVLQQVVALRHAVEAIRVGNIYPNGYSVSEANLAIDLRPIAAIWADHPEYQQDWNA